MEGFLLRSDVKTGILKLDNSENSNTDIFAGRGSIMQGFKGKGRISHALLAINTIPLLLMGLLIMFLSFHWFSKAMHGEIETELKNAVSSLNTLLELAYPGDYELRGDTVYDLYKGEYNISGDSSLVDRIKEETGFEVTIFYQNTRVLTTICTLDGQRILGTGAPEIIQEEVLSSGEAHFYDNAIINGSEYFSYYAPLRNSDNSVIGMLFVGKPRKSVDDAVEKAVYPILIAELLFAIIIAVINFIYNKKLVSTLLKIHRFLSDVSSGNLSARLDPSVLKRSDELREIGTSAINMQRSLTTMIDHDSLTELYNRRCADRRLRQVIENAIKHQTPFCIAIGDIDFFKRVNDSYGHECGDLVLKNIAACLKRHMTGKGFAARWGGEEFLLVYDHMNVREAYKYLQRLNFEIHDMECSFEGHSVSITMTFGLVAGDTDNVSLLLRNADDKLYKGKAAGRDCIMC